MNAQRTTTPRERSALKAATRQLLGLFGKHEAACTVTRVNAPTLSRYGSVSEPEHFAAIDVILDLEADIGSPVVTEALAHAQGYRLVRDERAGANADMDALMDALAGTIGAAGDFHATMAESLKHRIVTSEEQRAIAVRGEKLIHAIRLALEQINAAGGRDGANGGRG